MPRVYRSWIVATLAICIVAPLVLLNNAEAQATLKVSASQTLPGLSYVSRDGWTIVSASSQEPSQPASFAFDGSPNTYWHTPYGGPAGPHQLVIDLGYSRSIAGFIYLPRQDTCINGTIQNYEFYTSMDGQNWNTPAASGSFNYPPVTWNCSPTGQVLPDRMVTFPSRAARYIRFRAMSEVNGNIWASIAELNIIDGNDNTSPALRGQWSNVITTSVNPVGAAALPDGRVLIWSSFDRYAFGVGGPTETLTGIFNPATGTVTERVVAETAHDMFCPGTSFLGDGRLLITGGDTPGRSSIYNPATAVWTSGGNMNLARGYQGQTTLDDGTAFLIGGSWSGGSLGKNGELWANGSWRYLPNALASVTVGTDPGGAALSDRHPWVFAMGNGKVAHVGPSVAMNIFDTTVPNGATIPAGNRTGDVFSQNGTATMYDIGKILKVGGAPGYDNAVATANSYIIDVTNGISTTKTNSLRQARGMHNAVVLPNGEVLVVGGMPVPLTFNDKNSIFTTEIWTPSTGTWRDGAPISVPRNYHSVALLLPDGRVLSGGGGLCGQGCSANHSDVQLYSPPYLFKADGSAASRPVIATAPATAIHGGTIDVATTGGATQFVLMRYAAVTHSVNSDQRRVPLEATTTGSGQFRLSIPNSASAPPGNYMLFALDAAGVPSLSKNVMVQAPPRPTIAIAAPASGANFVAPASVVINATVTDPAQNIARVEFYNGSTLLGQDTTAPYSFTWQNATTGAYTLRATVVDATGFTASATTPITVTATQTFTNSSTIGNAQGSWAGTAFNLNCQSTEVLAGFTGRSTSTTVDQVGPLCVTVNATGAWQGSPVARGAAGGSTGTAFTKSCPVDQAVAGFQGRSGFGVDQLDLACRPLSSGGNVSGTSTFLGAVGGTGGSANAATYCPSPIPASGIRGVAGSLLGTFGLRCAVPAIVPNRAPVISLSSPANGAVYNAPADIVIAANASDPDNNLAKVEFFNGSTKLGERTSTPFTFNWTNVLSGSYNISVIASDLFGLTATTNVSVTVNSPAGSPPRVLQSLKGAPVPEPAAINNFIANRAAAIALGKALFWDTQVSSDGKVACASCHFQAGADVRFRNQSNPGMNRVGVSQFNFAPTKSGAAASGPNYRMNAADFPTYVLSDPLNSNSAATFETTDVMGSQGVTRRAFASAAAGQATDVCADSSDPIFGSMRQVTARNAPTVINAVFNHRNFHDGRANNVFNGVDSNGDRNTGAVIYRGSSATPTRISLENSSLASQAMVPVVNGGEMSCGGRTWPDAGRRLLKAKPLSGQSVAASDSVLASYVTSGVKGLNGDYEALVRAAFAADLWNSTAQIFVNGKNYSQAEANFSLFFGLAVQLYQATLVSDDAPIDRYFGTYPNTTPVNTSALTAEQALGLAIFNGKGNCISCHSGPQFTNAGTPAFQAAANGVIVDRMLQANGATGVYDFGFYNIGLRTTASDLGLGAADAFGNPLSFARQAVSGVRKDSFTVTPCAFTSQPCTPIDATTRAVVDGAFKTPTLRNVGLTGPYFHDGSRATLEDVVDFYVRATDVRSVGGGDSTGFGGNPSNLAGGLPRIELSGADRQALVAFLKFALTDDRVAYERAPFDHPELPLSDGHTGSNTDFVVIPAVGAGGRSTPVTPFDNLIASGSLGYPAAVNQTPVIATPAPQSNTVNSVVSLQISASDPENDPITYSATGLPTGLNINPATGLISGTATAAGVFNVAVTVRDTANNATSVNFTWSINTLPVTVSMTSPAANATFTLPANITLSATATQSGGAISRVEFYDGATLISTVTAAPYQFIWTSATAGAHSLTARAYGAANANATSAPVNITVNAAAAQPVSVSMTSPAASATFTLPANITLSATASQSGGAISRVEFYDGATLLSSVTAAPYQFIWTSATAGAHSLTARAYGAGNATATSAAVNITVNPQSGGGSCAFPSVAINDNFNRANGPLGGSWIGTVSGYTINGNQAVSLGGDSFIVNPTMLGADQEAYVKFTNIAAGVTEADVILKAGTATWWEQGALIVAYLPGFRVIQVWTYDNTDSWVMRSEINTTLSNGDIFGARVRGATGAVEVYRNGILIGNASVAGWTRQNATGMAGVWMVGGPGSSFDDFGSGNLTCTPGGGNVPPTVSIATNGTSFTAPASINITATAADSDGSIAKVEFFNGATKLGEDLTAPYTWSWTSVPAGTYAITARATDNLGAATTSVAINVTVNPPGNVAPTVSITTNGTSFTAPASINITATAADSDGSIAKVEFFNGATKLGEDLTAPYTWSWTSVPAGAYAITAKATDNLGAATTSAAINVTVNAPGNVAPTITITTNGTSFTAPASINITATAADSDGSIAKVEFFNGATKLGEDLTAPYTWSWTSVPAGAYSITAKATDNLGAATTSAAINVTVNAPGNVAPTVTITTNGTSFTAPASINITATAADSDGSIAKVEFFNGATKLGEDLTAPYTWSWTSVPAGAYVITAKATDNLGAATTSAAINVTVNAATGSCAFPSSTAITDNFNRANGAIGGNWAGATSGYSINNNQLTVAAGDQYIVWNQSAGPAVEASVKLTSINAAASEIDLVLKSVNSNWYSGTIIIAYTGGRLQVWSAVTGNWTQHNDLNVQLAAGDTLGGRLRPNGTVEVYKNNALVGSTTATGWPYLNATGFSGLWVVGGAGTSYDDFRTGTLTCQ